MTPPATVVLSMQHSGSVRLYSGRLALPYDICASSRCEERRLRPTSFQIRCRGRHDSIAPRQRPNSRQSFRCRSSDEPAPHARGKPWPLQDRRSACSHRARIAQRHVGDRRARDWRISTAAWRPHCVVAQSGQTGGGRAVPGGTRLAARFAPDLGISRRSPQLVVGRAAEADRGCRGSGPACNRRRVQAEGRLPGRTRRVTSASRFSG